MVDLGWVTRLSLLGAAATLDCQRLEAAAPPPPTKLAAVDEVFRDIGSMDPGCALGIAQRSKVVLRRGYGLASLEQRTPITPTTIFDAASISKQFTALSVLLLVEKGHLTLDDDVRRYIPELPDYGTPITIRQLLHHTGGLRDYGDLLSLAGRRASDPLTEDEALKLIYRQRNLNFAPGTQRQYSNTGYLLLAQVVHRVSGMTLKAFAADRIFRPLGMSKTFFQNNHNAVVVNRAWGYRRVDDGWFFSLPVNDTYGPSNLFTTIDDLLRWQANFEHPRVGTRQSLRLMQLRGTLATGEFFDYGLGLELVQAEGLLRVGHSGGNEGFNTMTLRFPERGLSVVVLCNETARDAPRRAQRVAAAFLGVRQIAATTINRPEPVVVARSVLEKFAGSYRNPSTNEVRQLEVRDGQLIYLRGSGSTLIPVTQNRFRFPGSANEIEFVERGNQPTLMRVLPQYQAPILYEAVPSFAPSGTQLRWFVGEYYSDEIETTYSVTADAQGLTIRGRLENPTRLKPVYPDAFFNGDLLIRFTRNATGGIDGLLVDQVRVRNLRFSKRADKPLYGVTSGREVHGNTGAIRRHNAA